VDISGEQPKRHWSEPSLLGLNLSCYFNSITVRIGTEAALKSVLLIRAAWTWIEPEKLDLCNPQIQTKLSRQNFWIMKLYMLWYVLMCFKGKPNAVMFVTRRILTILPFYLTVKIYRRYWRETHCIIKC
jgi:hypothetical protein